MGAFITNFQPPIEIEDLIDRFYAGETTNIDMLLEYEKYMPIEWTVDKNAVIDDTVFFMCAKTSKDHMGHVCVQAKEYDVDIQQFAERERQLYKEYAGNIIAIGKIANTPFKTEDSGWAHSYWRSPWYAEIKDFIILKNPVDISEFRSFIKVSRTGSITNLTDEQYDMLSAIIKEKNNS